MRILSVPDQDCFLGAGSTSGGGLVIGRLAATLLCAAGWLGFSGFCSGERVVGTKGSVCGLSRFWIVDVGRSCVRGGSGDDGGTDGCRICGLETSNRLLCLIGMACRRMLWSLWLCLTWEIVVPALLVREEAAASRICDLVFAAMVLSVWGQLIILFSIFIFYA